MSGLSFLIEISIAVGAIALILNGVALFLIVGLGGKIKKQRDLISFIHRRAKISERRDEQRLEKATPKRMSMAVKGDR
tara:strand:+ start:709 stop:942 length:234 start_codon:yes stop_codon:yes gene_type:complete